MTMHERIMAGKLFTDMCEGMPEERLQGKTLMKQFNDSHPADVEERMRLLKEIFGKPCDSWIEPPFYFCYGRHISLGKGTYINVNCNFIDDGKITIGDGCLFGPAVTIATVGHPINPAMREYMYCDHVTVGNNCWIGANSAGGLQVQEVTRAIGDLGNGRTSPYDYRLGADRAIVNSVQRAGIRLEHGVVVIEAVEVRVEGMAEPSTDHVGVHDTYLAVQIAIDVHAAFVVLTVAV